jgi:hypothetical protein
MGLIKWLFGKAIKDGIKEAIRELKQEQLVDSDLKTRIEIAAEEPVFKIKAILSNTTLTVVLPSGELVASHQGSRELLNLVLSATSEEEVKELLIPGLKDKQLKELEDIAEAQRVEAESNAKGAEVTPEQKVTIDNNTQHLLDSGDFEEINGGIYLKGVPIPIPQLMLFKFTELCENIFNWIKENPAFSGPYDNEHQVYETEYQALKNFWMWCVLCPSVNSRKELFQFLKNHDFKINKNGFFFAYRRVVSVEGKEEDAKLVSYITSEYIRIKIKNKQAPSKYLILKDAAGQYSTAKPKEDTIPLEEGISMVGNVKELYENVANLQEKVFTDAHTKTFDIRIGKEVTQDRRLCNDNSFTECGRGLHVGSKRFGFNGFGDTHILVLVNPMNAVSVPKYDAQKMRVCAYLPVAVISNQEEQTTFLEDADVLELGEEYFADQVASIEERAKEVAVENPDASEVQKIQDSKLTISEILEKQALEIKQVLKNRVVKI